MFLVVRVSRNAFSGRLLPIDAPATMYCNTIHIVIHLPEFDSMTKPSRLLKIFSFFLLISFLPVLASAEVTRLEITERGPFAAGKSFGQVGPYEVIRGKLHYETDPDDAANARVTDLKLAPRNARGKVESVGDFVLVTPVDPAKGNGRLLYGVNNRGNNLAIWTFNEGERTNVPKTEAHAGNGFLMRKGYSVLFSGWNGDVVQDGNRCLLEVPVATSGGKPIVGKAYAEILVDEPKQSAVFCGSPWSTSKCYPTADLNDPDAKLFVQRTRLDTPRLIPRESWSFAKTDNGRVVPDATHVTLKSGFQPGWVYDLAYNAKNPRVTGLGLTSIRDCLSFFRFAKKDEKGTANPLAGSVKNAFIFGISQSGRIINHLFYEGWNTDVGGRMILDGAIVHVAGAGRGSFNQRFRMTTWAGTHHWNYLSDSETFPFNSVPQTDPVTGESGDALGKLRKRGQIPKIMHVVTGTEYWSRGASLLHTDVEGKRDVESDPNVRVYLVSSAHHLGGGPTTKDKCRYPRNPLKDRGCVLRALLTALEQWVEDGKAPPASRHPRLDDGTLVEVDTFRKQFPVCTTIPYVPGSFYRPSRLDFGADSKSKGIATIIPPKRGNEYRTLVPAVDADGLDLAGIRLPDVTVPIATYTGWNLRGLKHGSPDMIMGLYGSYVEFPRTKEQRLASADPRPSIQERYATKEDYLARVRKAAEEMVAQRLLLAEDVEPIVAEAAKRDFWGDKK